MLSWFVRFCAVYILLKQYVYIFAFSCFCIFVFLHIMMFLYFVHFYHYLVYLSEFNIFPNTHNHENTKVKNTKNVENVFFAYSDVFVFYTFVLSLLSFSKIHHFAKNTKSWKHKSLKIRRMLKSLRFSIWCSFGFPLTIHGAAYFLFLQFRSPSFIIFLLPRKPRENLKKT